MPCAIGTVGSAAPMLPMPLGSPRAGRQSADAAGNGADGAALEETGRRAFEAADDGTKKISHAAFAISLLRVVRKKRYGDS